MDLVSRFSLCFGPRSLILFHLQLVCIFFFCSWYRSTTSSCSCRRIQCSTKHRTSSSSLVNTTWWVTSLLPSLTTVFRCLCTSLVLTLRHKVGSSLICLFHFTDLKQQTILKDFPLHYRHVYGIDALNWATFPSNTHRCRWFKRNQLF